MVDLKTDSHCPYSSIYLALALLAIFVTTVSVLRLCSYPHPPLVDVGHVQLFQSQRPLVPGS